jgi:hypothetical protein
VSRTSTSLVGKVVCIIAGGDASAFAVVARHARRVVLLYIFIEREAALDAASLCAGNADRVFRVGDIAIRENKWPIVADIPGFRREDWPIPRFGQQDALTGRYRAERPTERDLLSPASIEWISEWEAKELPSAALPNVAAVEIMLRRNYPSLRGNDSEEAEPPETTSDPFLRISVAFPDADSARAGLTALKAFPVEANRAAVEKASDARTVIVTASPATVEPFGDVDRFEQAIERVVIPFRGSIVWIETMV